MGDPSTRREKLIKKTLIPKIVPNPNSEAHPVARPKCGHDKMKVKQLIRELMDLPPELPVVIDFALVDERTQADENGFASTALPTNSLPLRA